MALLVQATKSRLNVRVNPSIPPVRLRLGTSCNDLGKGSVGSDNKAVLPNGFGKRLGQTKAIQRHDRPKLRFNPKCIGVITCVGHREYTIGIGLKQ
jgi:hypothetical protein